MQRGRAPGPEGERTGRTVDAIGGAEHGRVLPRPGRDRRAHRHPPATGPQRAYRAGEQVGDVIASTVAHRSRGGRYRHEQHRNLPPPGSGRRRDHGRKSFAQYATQAVPAALLVLQQELAQHPVVRAERRTRRQSGRRRIRSGRYRGHRQRRAAVRTERTGTAAGGTFGRPHQAGEYIEHVVMLRPSRRRAQPVRRNLCITRPAVDSRGPGTSDPQTDHRRRRTAADGGGRRRTAQAQPAKNGAVATGGSPALCGTSTSLENSW